MIRKKILIQFLVISLLSLSVTLLYSQTLIDKTYDQKYIDNLENKLPTSSVQERTEILNILSEAHWFIDPDKTIEYANEALKLSQNQGDKKNEGYALINLCQGYLLNDEYDKALDYGLKSLEVREQLNDQDDIIFTLRTIGWLYYDINNSEMAYQYHKKVLDYHLQLNDPKRIAYSYNSIGLVYAQMKQPLPALDYFKKSLNIKESHGFTERISETLTNMGRSYLALGEYDLAKEYSLMALRKIEKRNNDDHKMAEVFNLLAGIYLKLGDLENAELSLTRANLAISNLADDKELTMENHLIASDLYNSRGDYKKSLHYFKLYTNLKSSILSLDKNNKLAEMRISYENEKRENEIKILEREKEIVNVKRKGLTAGIILLAIIAILIIARLKSSQKKRRILYETNKKLADAQLKNEQLEQEKLKDQLQFKSQELVNFSLHISQKNEMYKEFIRQLQEIEFMNKEDASRKIQKLTRYFNQNLKFNETLDDYESDIGQIEDEFFYKLHSLFPNLTDNDRRLMAQLRLKLSSKEISTLNNISIKSVEISRYRLRKKLSLKTGESLTGFVQSI